MGTMNLVTETAKTLAEQLAGFMGSTVGELFRDRVHYLRWKNAQKILDRAEHYLNDRHTQGKKTLPLGQAIRFLDGASLEEDPTLQDLGARLLVNAAGPENK